MADSGRRQAVHKSGPLKQQNKAHKNGKHRTKGQIAALFKGEWARSLRACPERFIASCPERILTSCPVVFSGRVSFKSHSRNSRKEARKAERKNKASGLKYNSCVMLCYLYR